MGTKRARTIPCIDCTEWKEDLTQKGFRILGCINDPTTAGFCTLVFEEAEEQTQIENIALHSAFNEMPKVFAAKLTQNPTVASATSAVTSNSVPWLTATQVKTIQAIVNIFETSEVLGDYSQVTVISGDTGHLTYGRSQTTLGSKNLTTLLERYCAVPGARFASKLQPYLPRFQAIDLSLDTDKKLHNILRISADDPTMRETQDSFFDEVYWQPSLRTASTMGMRLPLSVTVVYDSLVHGSWGWIRDRTNENFGTLSVLGEKDWVKAYIANRREWLDNQKRADLRATTYRMDALQRLIDQEYWALDLPLVVRGKEISLKTLSAVPPGCYDGPALGSRSISVQSPLLRGLDVRLVQFGLSEKGIDIKADGVFGQTSMQCIKRYQAELGIPETGIADVDLIMRLAK